MKYLFIFIGGLIGATFRLSFIQLNLFNTDELYNIILVNLIGCVLLGIVYSLNNSLFNQYFIQAGLISSFTTYSAFNLHSIQMIDQYGAIGVMIFILSILFSIIIFFLTVNASKSLFKVSSH
ncbi:fluoride efflux transporter FluC [Abyssicoccus albus]|uniref:fluoride efflux transporter FluC n=1 Tax=Abyssicoccus albus TaxID=1817405 RepID=UPI00097E1932|nr:CrcB family protein [Abyssicoccus albus]AQL56526.1 hypothetical protein BVH56_06135 [Abyssicoccus albus]